MKLRCWPGAMAIITRAPDALSGLNGKTVKCVRLSPIGTWHIERRVTCIVSVAHLLGGQLALAGESWWFGDMHDAWLTPITPPAGADDTVADVERVVEVVG